MGHSQADKARSRERILNEAATQIRDKGLDAISIGSLMQKVNLTHGGFYGHFRFALRPDRSGTGTSIGRR
ncbi:TetR/AcrR family transcriptional regulator [Bradyrhizobium sp. ISRA435]|nr:TetR/AcrR family transcriptional regulator [Bradyrhizobium sp. ISRA435]